MLSFRFLYINRKKGFFRMLFISNTYPYFYLSYYMDKKYLQKEIQHPEQ